MDTGKPAPGGSQPGRTPGVAPGPHRVKVRGHWHFTECAVTMYPEDFPDKDCTCLDWGPY
jgi:hypothetical protein